MSTFITVYKGNFFDITKYAQNLQTLHGAVNKALGCENTGRTAAEGLFHLEQNETSETVWLYVQGNREAGEICSFTKTRVICLDNKIDSLRSGDILQFELRCSPMVHRRKADGNRRKYLNKSAERMEWLKRQGERLGFDVLQYNETGKVTVSFQHKGLPAGKEQGKKDAFDVNGFLKVTDADIFKDTMKKGVGSGKAYGLGMLFVKK